MDARVRVGLLLDSLFLPAWVFSAVERLVGSNHAELALVILEPSQLAARPGRRLARQDSAHGLYHSFDAIDRKLFLRGPDALAQVDASELLSSAPKMHLELPVGNNPSEQHLRPETVTEIRSHSLDVLIRIGRGKVHGDLLSVAKYGVWTYRWGDPRKIEDGLTGFWEVVRGWPETGASLQQLSSESTPSVTLFESWFFTYPFSPARNRNYLLWAAASFLPRQVEALHRTGGEKYFGQRHCANGRPQALQANKTPSNLEVLWITPQLAFNNLREAYRRKFSPKRWELLYSFEPEAEKKLASFNRITPPRDRFWADPHVIYHDPNYYIFIEEYPFQTQRGHIAVMEMDQAGNYKQPTPIIQEKYHLSFPFVFRWLGQYYMIPESSENKTIDLYECVEFPHRWQHKLTLMKDIKAVDTTVVHAQGKWWLFTAMAEQQAAAPQVELFLFYADELFTGQWKSHPMNPIVSDVKKARGAGGIFMKDERLFRPSQYCSSTYGHGFDLNEIVSLSETEYCERTMTTVRPEHSKIIIATHTYANQGNLTVMDALVRRQKWVKKT